MLVLTAGADTFDQAVWGAVPRSRIGDAFFLRAGGLALAMAYALPWRAGPFMAVVGAVAVVASYAAMGHSMLYRPRQELAALGLIHLGVVAFWIGSLLPLALVAQRLERADAAELITGSWWGCELIAKLLLVSGLIGFAAWYKLRLTPALARGETGADDALARSIKLEFVVVACVFWAVAEMASVHPINIGHHIQG